MFNKSWAGQKLRLSFFVTSYGKTRINFLANPRQDTTYLPGALDSTFNFYTGDPLNHFKLDMLNTKHHFW